MKQFSVQTSKRTELVDITRKVQEVVREAGVEEAVCTVFVPHTTAAVTVNENADPDVARDILSLVDRLIPFDSPEYRHQEGNSAAHIKSSLFGCSQTVLVHEGGLQLGTWQGIYLAEFDGPRTRKVWVSLSPVL